MVNPKFDVSISFDFKVVEALDKIKWKEKISRNALIQLAVKMLIKEYDNTKNLGNITS